MQLNLINLGNRDEGLEDSKDGKQRDTPDLAIKQKRDDGIQF